MKEVYISVDIEATGSVPTLYSMLSLGACVVSEEGPPSTFYREIKPIEGAGFEPEAMKHCIFSEKTEARIHAQGGGPHAILTALTELGVPPRTAMEDFATWLRTVSQKERGDIVFVGFNAPYDWGFVNHYFKKYFWGHNPFGINALDIKGYYMGMTNCRWRETSKKKIDPRFRPQRRHTHHALDDAREQAEMFLRMLQANQRRLR